MKKILFLSVGSVLLFVMMYLTVRYFSVEEVTFYLNKLIQNPVLLLLMFALYAAAFVLRAWAWKWYSNRPVPFKVYFSGLIYSLLFNHLLPIKAGDGFRVYVLMRENTDWDEALHSTVVMRTLDLFILGLIASTGAFMIGFKISILYFLLLIVAVILIVCFLYVLFHKGRLRFIGKHFAILREALKGTKGAAIVSFIAISWMFEAAVVIGIARALGWHLSAAEAVWVNSMTIAGQTFQMTPGGIGSYESVMSLSLVQTGFTWEDAYMVALMTHGFKFAFSYIAGLCNWFLNPLFWQEIRPLMKGKGIVKR